MKLNVSRIFMGTAGILPSYFVVVGTAELLESAARLKFSNIAKGLFNTQAAKADLLNIELNSPGNEVSYIYQTKEAFS